MLWETISVVRDLPRLHEIASVMIRYGWGDLVRLLGISGVLERAGRVLHWHSTSEITSSTRRCASAAHWKSWDRLSSSWDKCWRRGSTCSRRTGLPNSRSCTARCPRCPTKSCYPDLVAALKGEPGEVFAEFDTVPLAAASIAQVHRATLKDGTPVVVKIRRPGIEDVIRADLRILEHAARLLESEVPDSRRYDPVHIVSQFRAR
jgi:ubiquinone biosynthesis protein